jgi:hypothetical protein
MAGFLPAITPIQLPERLKVLQYSVAPASHSPIPRHSMSTSLRSLIVALAALLACALPAQAQSDRPGASRPAKKGEGASQQPAAKKDAAEPAKKKAAKEGDPAKKSPRDAGPPIVFYLAKGEPHACGPGCSEWIAAEGAIDRGAGARLRALLDRLGARRPPIFFHSPGGSVGDAIEIGQIMRARKMTASIGWTVPQGCDATGAPDRACNVLKRSGRELPAHIDAARGRCASACVYALVGAAVRQVPAGVDLGIHASRIVLRVKSNRAVSLNHPVVKQFARDRLQAGNARLAAYIEAMGIDKGLLEAAQRISPDKMHLLTRDEIARYGIDTRDVVESGWTVDPRPSAAPAVLKLVSDARNGKDYRNVIIRLVCEPNDRIGIQYWRELPAGETALARAMKVATHGGGFEFAPALHKATSTSSKRELEGRGARVPVTLLEEAAAGGTIEISEASDKAGEPPHRVTTLSTAGLARSLATLRQRCTEADSGPAVPTL